MEPFLLRAILAGVGVAVVAAPLGAFIVWRRMAYFGDALSHAALLGVALGFATGISVNFGILGVCLAFALFLTALGAQRRLAQDTLLGIMAHSTLSLGLVVLAVLQTLQVDLLSYLFGDILAVGPIDLYWILGGGLLMLGLLAWIWRPLLAITVHEDLARVEGVPVARVKLIFMLMIAFVIAMAMKIVGVVLITSLLIIPAAAARRMARTPEGMALGALAVGVLSVFAGIGTSLVVDAPTGPMIVVSAAVFFLVSLALPQRS
jgi:zinc transport system permease protein